MRRRPQNLPGGGLGDLLWVFPRVYSYGFVFNMDMSLVVVLVDFVSWVWWVVVVWRRRLYWAESRCGGRE